MRPVNLIPLEDRRGDRAPMRTGPVAYLLVGALALALAGVTAVVFTNNQISDREEEITGLEVQQAAATETAQALAPYAEFAAVKEARTLTVDSLARSRFDWERVLRELALILPAKIQLTNVSGTAAPGITLEGSSASSLREGATGPALQIDGCTAHQDTVAELAAALEDIDGVTRVGVDRSARSAEEGKAAVGPTASATTGCEADVPVYEFSIVAAFDAVTVPTTAPGVPGEATPAAETVSDPAVGDAQGQEQQAGDSIAGQTGKARDAAENLVPGVAR